MSVDLGAGNDHFGWAMDTFDAINHSRFTLDVTGGIGNDQGARRLRRRLRLGRVRPDRLGREQGHLQPDCSG